MSRVILDSSALLALIKNEPGALIVEELLGDIVMSSVNVSESAAVILDSEMSVEQGQQAIEPFIESVIPFDFEHSITCAALKKDTKHLGLSLGDRACISLGMKLKLPIYTADKIWSELKLEDADIRFIR
ncbi:type II toxin-antitoxin system VapC family toxin [Candidatus Tisiphia endosymbiont of Nemotelus uliginosus]|uniref:type II toxin-antitoxin system VapC family toxin n=1 Tax=Candidatus Tisiphia endosymbiont of Nemotelus uliginosus TaxID=3077926 RepID=UPI0035C8A387